MSVDPENMIELMKISQLVPILPPPEATFNSREELHTLIQEFAMKNGYAFSTGRSKRLNTGDRIKIQYNCDFFGPPLPEDRLGTSLGTRKRMTCTRKTDCQFSVMAIQQMNNKWELRHRPWSEFNRHNHPPSQLASCHPAHRQLEKETTDELRNLHNAGKFSVKPRQAMTYLQEKTSTPLQPYDVYNMYAFFKREQRLGLPANNALIQHFVNKCIHHKLLLTDNNRIRRLFIAYPESIDLVLKNQDVVLVDYTYKSNKFDIPLLHMIGITGSGLSFTMGFCFLADETKEDFTWAFQCSKDLQIIPGIICMDDDKSEKNASEDVFHNTPTLICIWHVNKCVLANCKKIVGNEDWEEFDAGWRNIVQSPTIPIFNQNLLEFREKYSSQKYVPCLTYLEKQWLREGQKERLVYACTDRHLHFGMRVTSRVEGAHAYIRRYLGSQKTKGDLLSTWLSIETAGTDQLTSVTTRTSMIRNRTPLQVDRKLFQGCFGVVTWYALSLVQKHLDTVSRPLRPCTGKFKQTMGLPCAHVCEIENDTFGLTPDDFHEHWHWDRESTTKPLLDPMHIRMHRSRSVQVARTGRILSRGEEVTRREHVCSACHPRGHNMRNLNCPMRHQELISLEDQARMDLDADTQPRAITPTITLFTSIPSRA